MARAWAGMSKKNDYICDTTFKTGIIFESISNLIKSSKASRYAASRCAYLTDTYMVLNWVQTIQDMQIVLGLLPIFSINLCILKT
jgi:hypothetical protein